MAQKRTRMQAHTTWPLTYNNNNDIYLYYIPVDNRYIRCVYSCIRDAMWN